MRRPYTQRSNGTIVDAKWQVRRNQLRRNADLIHQLGLAHRWTGETARKAALKMWASKRKGRSGRRLGFPAKLSPRIDHQLMRDYYSCMRDGPGVGVVYYIPEEQRWAIVEDRNQTYYARTISERAALTRLGHLKRRK